MRGSRGNCLKRKCAPFALPISCHLLTTHNGYCLVFCIKVVFHLTLRIVFSRLEGSCRLASACLLPAACCLSRSFLLACPRVGLWHGLIIVFWPCAFARRRRRRCQQPQQQLQKKGCKKNTETQATPTPHTICFGLRSHFISVFFFGFYSFFLGGFLWYFFSFKL